MVVNTPRNFRPEFTRFRIQEITFLLLYCHTRRDKFTGGECGEVMGKKRRPSEAVQCLMEWSHGFAINGMSDLFGRLSEND